ncbi:MAG TPA: hypothetical protein VG889_10935 [Rhizomicrobium sp.]|nr:hypothetical protein [Rhizomicrobium sp.]
MTRSALLVSTAIGLTFAASGPVAALAAKPHAPGAFLKKSHDFQHAKGAPARPARGGHPAPFGLKEMYVVDKWSSTAAPLFSGFQVIDTTPLSCKKACTVITDTVATFASYYSYNQVALCPTVDGYFTNGSCMSINMSPTGQTIVPQLTNATAGAGTHTAAFYVYAIAPAYLSGFQIDYHVYK